MYFWLPPASPVGQPQSPGSLGPASPPAPPPPASPPPTVSPPASPVILHEDPHLGEVELEEMEMEELDIPLPADTEQSI